MNDLAFTAEVQRVTFSNGDFSIVKMRLDDEQTPQAQIPHWLQEERTVTCVGEFGGTPEKGALYDLAGELTFNPRFGRQVKVRLVERCIRADDRAIGAFLRSFPHIGPVRANQIMDLFDGPEDIMDAFENTERLAEVVGLSPERIMEIKERFHDERGRRDDLLWCLELEVTSYIAARILNVFKGRGKAELTADPYQIMRLPLGFEDADRFAKKHFNIADDDPRRAAAAAQFVLEAATREGHVYSTLDDLFGPNASDMLKKTIRSTKFSANELAAALETASFPRKIEGHTFPPVCVLEEGRAYLAKIHTAEKSLAIDLARLLQTVE